MMYGNMMAGGMPWGTFGGWFGSVFIITVWIFFVLGSIALVKWLMKK